MALEADRRAPGGLCIDLDGIDRIVFTNGVERHCHCERCHEGGFSTIILRALRPAMSTHHAQLVRDGCAWTAQDVGSADGTFLN